MPRFKAAIIGGTGVYDQPLLEDQRELVVETRFGPALLQSGFYRGRAVSFLYRANITALRNLGIRTVIAAAALVSNYAAGISEAPLTGEAVYAEINRGKASLERLLVTCVEIIGEQRSCSCQKCGGRWPWEGEPAS